MLNSFQQKVSAKVDTIQRPSTWLPGPWYDLELYTNSSLTLHARSLQEYACPLPTRLACCRYTAVDVSRNIDPRDT